MQMDFFCVCCCLKKEFLFYSQTNFVCCFFTYIESLWEMENITLYRKDIILEIKIWTLFPCMVVVRLFYLYFFFSITIRWLDSVGIAREELNQKLKFVVHSSAERIPFQGELIQNSEAQSIYNANKENELLVYTYQFSMSFCLLFFSFVAIEKEKKITKGISATKRNSSRYLQCAVCLLKSIIIKP